MKKIFKNNRPFKLTRGGWIFVLYSIGVGAGAINTGNNLLYLIFGIFLGLIMASGVLSDINLWRIRYKVDMPHYGEAGQPGFLILKLTNAKSWIPSISVTAQIEVEIRGKKILLNTFFPSIAKKGTVAKEVPFHPPHRGYFEIKQVRLYTRFPFGLLRKQWNAYSDKKSGTFVSPRLIKLSLDEYNGGLLGEETQTQSEHRGESITISSLRPFRQDDNPKFIHWKSSAKRGSLVKNVDIDYLIREMEQDDHKQLTILWPTLNELSGLPTLEVEKCIQLTASLVSIGNEQGHQIHLILGEDPDQECYEVVKDIEEFLAIFEQENAPGEMAQSYVKRKKSHSGKGISIREWRHVA